MSSDWPRIEIGQVAKLRSGFPFKSADWKDSGVPVIKIANIKGGRIIAEGCGFVSSEVASKSAEWYTRTGDVLIAMTGYVGEVAQAKPGERYLINQRVGRFDFTPNADVEPTYFFYHLQHPDTRAEIEGVARGSAQPNLSAGDAHKIKITLPPLAVQSEIAATLGALDDRITLLRETNATLEAIAQALFKSWFVDFDPVRAKMEGRTPEGMDEATAALFPDSFEETELGAVPRGWRVIPLGDVVPVTDYVANGSFAALKENVTLLDRPSYAIYVRTTDYNSGFSGDFRYVNKSAYEFLSKSSLDGSEVIISNVGDVGTVFRPPKWLGLPMTLGSNAVALKKSDMSAYLYFHFSGPLGQHRIQSIITGSAQLKFNKTNFRALRLLLPESKCLSAFEEIANFLLSRIDANLTQSKHLCALRDELLPRLISGQLRVLKH